MFFRGDTGNIHHPCAGCSNALYEWNDDTTTIGPVLAVRESGSGTVKVNGCAVTDSLGVFTREPNLELGRNHMMCRGEQLTLNAASENATYQWFLNGVNLNFGQS